MRHAPDPLIVETVERLLEARCDAACIAATERGEPARGLWEAIEASAVHRAWLPAALGGADVTVADVCAIVRAGGRHGAPVPLADTLLAGRLCAAHGIELDDGMIALAPWPLAGDALSLRAGRLDGRCTRVPFARFARAVVVTLRDDGRERLALLAPESCTVHPGTSLAGEPLDTIELAASHPVALETLDDGWTADAVVLAGALLRAHMMAGALERILGMSVDYARERHAFGRPIAAFQAVQHALAELAAEAAAASAAANAAMLAVSAHGLADPRCVRAVASAKIRAGEAAGAAAAIAHQVHGAMGFTREHRLHQFTRRLWSWRDEYGQETTWAVRLGRLVAADGADALWPALTES